MEVIVRLKINPDVPIVFKDCHFNYDTDTRELVVVDLEGGVQAVYDAETLHEEVVWKL